MMIATVAVSVVYFVITAAMMLVVNRFQEKPYMDEIFHVPQAQQYCDGNFTQWDPMITTLPGLYLVSAAVLSPLSKILPAVSCTTASLRAINLGFMTANVAILSVLSFTLNKKAKKVKGHSQGSMSAALTAAATASYPVLYMFSFLYYTDAGAVFWVLVMYLACLKHAHVLTGLSGIVAVLFRQTNIIWVVFIAGITAEEEVFSWLKNYNREAKNSAKLDQSSCGSFLYFGQLLTKTARTKPREFWKLLFNLFLKLCPYAVVVASFLGFVYVNNGIVVGDRSHHQACLNFPQVFYFLSTCLVFAFMHLISPNKILKCLGFLLQHPFVVAGFVVLSAYFIANFTVVHEYTLADNRHYTFYVWSKIYRKHEMVKFLLIPVYFYGFWQFWSSLAHKSVLWNLVFLVCVFASLVPQKLLEFRYYIIPFFIWRLNIHSTNKLVTFCEILYFTFINAVMLYLFLYKPFKWPHSDEVQRFMW